MGKEYRIILCLNQFFGGLGGENKANVNPALFQGPLGPGLLLQKAVPNLKVIKTIVFGDNYIAGHTESAVEEIVQMLRNSFTRDTEEPNFLLAGPAFNAGRYGLGCGAICTAIKKEFNFPAVTAMYPENPAVNEYKKELFIVATSKDVMGMEKGLEQMVRLAKKLLKGRQLDPKTDGYIPRGRRQNYFAGKSGAERGVDLLLQKLQGDSFHTEYSMPIFDRVTPAPSVSDMSRAKIALVTSGGIVPWGNPDRIESASASHYGCYPIKNLRALTPQTHQSIHGGYDPTYANQDPNRVLPLDGLCELLDEKLFASLYPYYYATVGNATSVARAVEFGREIGKILVADGVQGVILTST